MQYYVRFMPLYRLRSQMLVQKLADALPSDERHVSSAALEVIKAGEIVEAVSAASHEGRVIIRHEGTCYRVWKEDLQDIRIAERINATMSADVEQSRQ